jgi:cyclase
VTGHGQDSGALGTVTEVADGVFAYVQPDGTWWINNTGFLVGRRRITAIDACATERRTRALQEAIGRVSSAPVRTLINTHHHGDHTFGNYLFEDATIVAQDRARDAMLEAGTPFSAPFWTEVDWGHIDLAPPFLTFAEQVTHWVDDLRCEVIHPNTAAHTTNDAVVWIPERRVLFAGDLLFNGGTPFWLMGSAFGMLDAVDFLRRFGAETIVPGHGPICGPEVIDRVGRYVRFVLSLANQARSARLSPLEAAREADLGEFPGLTDPERLVGNLHRAMAELDGVERGGAIDLRAALGDMVAFNDGRPLTCHA